MDVTYEIKQEKIADQISLHDTVKKSLFMTSTVTSGDWWSCTIVISHLYLFSKYKKRGCICLVIFMHCTVLYISGLNLTFVHVNGLYVMTWNQINLALIY